MSSPEELDQFFIELKEAAARREAKAGPLIDKDTRYEDDFACRVFVHMYPHGQSLIMIGDVLKLSRERVRQIEAKALKKLLIAVKEMEFDEPDEEGSPYEAMLLGAAGRKHL